MQIHKLMKEAITEHKKKVELTQWAIISGITSLIYSEYIRRIQHKTVPVQCYMVPEIEAIKELLKSNSPMMERLSNDLIDSMVQNQRFWKYTVAPELILFREEKIEIMKTIFDLYITPNIQRRVPETIAMKFGLNGDVINQTIRQDRTIDLFDRKPFGDDQFKFIVNQCCLQLLVLLPTMKKNIDVPEDNMKIQMSEEEILMIGNENAICPIYFDAETILSSCPPKRDYDPSSIGKITDLNPQFTSQDLMELLQFVTSTQFSIFDNDGVAAQKEVGTSRELQIIKFGVRTAPLNQIGLIHLEGIDSGKAEDGEGQ